MTEASDSPDQAPPGYPAPPPPEGPAQEATSVMAPTEVFPTSQAVAPGAPVGPTEQPGWVPPAPPPPAPPPPPPPPPPAPPPPPPLPPRPPSAAPPPVWPPAPGAPSQPPSPDPGGWGQPAPGVTNPAYGAAGYAAPGYPAAGSPSPGYPAAPGRQQSPPAAPAGPAVPRPRPLANLAVIPPALLASLAISAGVVVLFLADLLIALGEPSGTRGNLRLLQFLSPGDLAVGAIMIVAVALVALVPVPEGAPASALKGAAEAKLVAGVVAVAVGAAALVRAIVVLTIAHQHAAVKLGNMVDALAAVIVAAAAAYWAFKPRRAW